MGRFAVSLLVSLFSARSFSGVAKWRSPENCAFARDLPHFAYAGNNNFLLFTFAKTYNRTRRSGSLYRAVTYTLIAGAVARVIAIAVQDPHFVDFYCFVDATEAMLRGLDPHVLANLRYTRWEEAPLVFPGLTLFFIPFASIGPAVGKYIYFVMNVAAGIAFYGAVIRASGLCTRFSIRNPELQTVLVTLGGFLFVNSIFFTLCIRVGQVSLFVALLLVLAVTARREWQRILFFGLAAVVKYSTVPVLGMQLFFIRRQFRFCLMSFVLFATVSLYPLLLGHNLIDLYQSYLACMQRWIAPGAANHFANSGQTMLSSGLFKTVPSVVLNIAVLGLFLAAGFYRRKRQSQNISLHEWFAIACVTMTLEYHRTYDGVVVYPFLLLTTYSMYRERKWGHAAILVGFASFFALPGAVVDRLGHGLGRIVGENPVVYMPAGQFPLLSALFVVMTLYALYLYAFIPSTVAMGACEEKRHKELAVTG